LVDSIEALRYPVVPARNVPLNAALARTHKLPRIERADSDDFESARLARRWFAAVQERTFEHLGDLVHDDVVLVSKLRPGHVVEGKTDFLRFVEEYLGPSLYEATADSYEPVDDQRIVVEGRLRWIDDDRVIRDDPVTWAMTFRDGLLSHFIPARSRAEAATILDRSTP
jgi:ketosteroid isomerase-like protein